LSNPKGWGIKVKRKINSLLPWPPVLLVLLFRFAVAKYVDWLMRLIFSLYAFIVASSRRGFSQSRLNIYAQGGKVALPTLQRDQINKRSRLRKEITPLLC
jgi:hypothetical protein